MNQLSAILKKGREKKNLTQEEVASRLGISQRAYAFYEDGARNPKLSRLNKIAEILDLDKAELAQIVTPGLVQNVPRELQDGALYNLTSSNKILAESNKVLADSNADLVRMVVTIGYGGKGIHSGVSPNVADLLELLAVQGTPKRWKTKQQGLAELHSFFFGPKGRKKGADIHDD